MSKKNKRPEKPELDQSDDIFILNEYLIVLEYRRTCGYPEYKIEKYQIGVYSSLHEAEAAMKSLNFKNSRHSFLIEKDEYVREWDENKNEWGPSCRQKDRSTYLPNGKLLCESESEWTFECGDIVEVLRHDGTVTIGIVTDHDAYDVAENNVYLFAYDKTDVLVFSPDLFPPRFPVPDEIKNRLRTKYLEKGVWHPALIRYARDFVQQLETQFVYPGYYFYEWYYYLGAACGDGRKMQAQELVAALESLQSEYEGRKNYQLAIAFLLNRLKGENKTLERPLSDEELVHICLDIFTKDAFGVSDDEDHYWTAIGITDDNRYYALIYALYVYMQGVEWE